MMTESHLGFLPGRLKRLRKEAQLSQADLASRLGLSQSAISAVERGRRNPSLHFLASAADALGVSIAELLAAPSATNMTMKETELLHVYRSLAEPAQGHVRAFIDFLTTGPRLE